MSSTPAVPGHSFRGRLARSLLFILLLLSLVPLLLMGATAYLRSRALLRQQVFALFSNVVSAQARRVASQAETGQLLLERVVANEQVSQSLYRAVSFSGKEDLYFPTLRTTILDDLQSINAPVPFYNQFLVVMPDGTVALASKKDWEGRHTTSLEVMAASPEVKGPAAAFSRALLTDRLDLYQTPAGQDQPANSLVILTAVPVLSPSGELAATVIGVAESVTVRGWLDGASFYADAHYFVTPSGEFIGANPYPNSFEKLILLPPTAAQSQRVVAQIKNAGPALADKPGVTELISFKNTPVISGYTWLPDLQVGWVAEVAQARVYSQINTLLVFMAILFVGASALMALILWQAIRSFVRPLASLTSTVQLFAEGNWEQRAPVNRQDEIGLLAHSFNGMADELTGLYHSLEAQVAQRTAQVRTAAELSQVVTSSANLDDLLRKSLNILANRFGCRVAAIYLAEEPLTVQRFASGRTMEYLPIQASFAILRQAVGTNEAEKELIGKKVSLEPTNLIGWVARFNQARVSSYNRPKGSDKEQKAEFGAGERADLLPGTLFEAVLPIITGDQILGVVSLQFNRAAPNGQAAPINEENLAELRTLVGQIAPSIQNYHLLELVQINLQETSLLYRASQQILQAKREEEIFLLALRALAQTPYNAAFLLPRSDRVEVRVRPGISTPGWIPVLPVELEAAFISQDGSGPIVINDLQSGRKNGGIPPVGGRAERSSLLPPPVLEWSRRLGTNALAFVPVTRAGRLAAVLILGTGNSTGPGFTTPTLQPYINLVELVVTTLEKVQALDNTRASLVELQTLSAVGQAIGAETNLDTVYRVIHQQVEQAIGKVSFYLALYDAATQMIEIPYLAEGDILKAVGPYPLGEGLTSILIRTRQPLMLVQDTEARTAALGAKITGQPAKSWLGVPLLLGGEPVGAIVVQDTEMEERFNESHLRLLTTIASQVAIVIRNARLIETARRQAERERLLFQISSKIRRSTDIPTILQTTAEELGAALKARRARVEVAVAADGDDFPDPGPATGIGEA